MDPLSISASVIAVLQLTGTVLQYLNCAGNASDERRKVYSELCGTRNMLYILHSQATKPQLDDSCSSTMQSLCIAEGPLDQYKAALERLAEILKPSRGISKVTTAISWSFKAKEAKDLLDSIERLKTLLSLARQNDHM